MVEDEPSWEEVLELMVSGNEIIEDCKRGADGGFLLKFFASVAAPVKEGCYLIDRHFVRSCRGGRRTPRNPCRTYEGRQ